MGELKILKLCDPSWQRLRYSHMASRTILMITLGTFDMRLPQRDYEQRYLPVYNCMLHGGSTPTFEGIHCLHHQGHLADYIIGLFFYTRDVCSTFLRNFSELLPDYIPERLSSRTFKICCFSELQ
jgi:hypothetical protein